MLGPARGRNGRMGALAAGAQLYEPSHCREKRWEGTAEVLVVIRVGAPIHNLKRRGWFRPLAANERNASRSLDAPSGLRLPRARQSVVFSGHTRAGTLPAVVLRECTKDIGVSTRPSKGQGRRIVIIDVGSNNGDWSRSMAHDVLNLPCVTALRRKSVRFIMVEPQQIFHNKVPLPIIVSHKEA